MSPTRYYRKKRTNTPYKYSPPFLIDSRLRARPSFSTTHVSNYQNPHTLKCYAIYRYKKYK